MSHEKAQLEIRQRNELGAKLADIETQLNALGVEEHGRVSRSWSANFTNSGPPCRPAPSFCSVERDALLGERGRLGLG